MIHVDFDPSTLSGAQLTWWTAWEVRAKAATDAVLAAWEAWRKDPNDKTYSGIFDKPAITSVWGDLKDWLLTNFFNKKCAYCETPSPRAPFHAEHYRPKGRVTSDGKKVQVKDEKGGECDHPGYFWLAFHWKNLLPSCNYCNTVNGKKNQFPIPQPNSYLSVLKNLSMSELKCLIEKRVQSTSWPEIYYFQPSDLDSKEGRLLLHPYFDDPRKSLIFNEFGVVLSTGNAEEKARGEMSITAYNLNDGAIVAERYKEQLDVHQQYSIAYNYHLKKGMSMKDASEKAKEDIAGYLNGKEPYSAAVVDYLRASFSKHFETS